jgi:hypothetical protein
MNVIAILSIECKVVLLIGVTTLNMEIYLAKELEKTALLEKILTTK